MIDYRKDIDSLRALAVIGVLLFHLDIPFITGGYVGVDVFFVISGYLITNILLNALSSKNLNLKDFFVSRLLRLFPALFVMLFTTLPLAYVFLYQDAFIAFASDFKYTALQISNIHFADKFDYFRLDAEKSPLLHTWSLGVEAQFYLLWPFLLLVLKKWIGKKQLIYAFIIIGALSVGLGQYLLTSGEGTQAFYMLYSRAYQLILGAILATSSWTCCFSSAQKPFVFMTGVAMILISFFVFQYDTLTPGINGLLPTFGAVLVIAARIHEETTWISKLWQSSVLVYIGLISYSLYIWHWPLITIAKTFTGLALSPMMVVGLVIASFTISVASYHYIEQPARRIRKNLSSKGKNWVIFIVFVAIGVAVITSDLVSSKLEKYKLDLDKQISISSYEPDFKNKISKFYGTEGQDTDVLLIGDSHGRHYSEAVIHWASGKNMTVETAVRNVCQMVGNDDTQIRKSKKCKPYHIRIKARLTSAVPLKYLFIAQRLDILVQEKDELSVSKKARVQAMQRHETMATAAYQQTIDLVKKHHPNIKIILLGQTPKMKSNPLVCRQQENLWVRRHLKLEANCTLYEVDLFTMTQIVAPLTVALRGIEGHNSSVLLYSPLLAFPYDRIEEWGPLYVDGNHLSKEGSLHAGKYFNF
jgi:peptidoglycan/LPS O-acetylase OafA/YrhL